MFPCFFIHLDWLALTQSHLPLHFQAVKHDVWDRDFPANPVLVTVLRDGKLVDAVAQATKSGHVYVFTPSLCL